MYASKHCALANVLLQRAMHQQQHSVSSTPHPVISQGLSEEVAAAGVSLMGYFSVFHQMLVNRLMRANACSAPQQLQRLSQEVQDACVRSEHTYVYAQLLLHKLSEAEAVAALQHEAQLAALEAAGLEPEEEERQLAVAPGVYRRMAQDVDEALIAQGLGAKVWAMQVGGALAQAYRRDSCQP